MAYSKPLAIQKSLCGETLFPAKFVSLPPSQTFPLPRSTAAFPADGKGDIPYFKNPHAPMRRIKKRDAGEPVKLRA